MTEKRLLAIPPQPFTVNGDGSGLVTIADTSLFKVKQKVIINGTSLPILDQLEIKQILNSTQMYVGPHAGNISMRVNLLAYTTLAGATIKANEQLRPVIPSEDFNRAVYEEEPTVAIRSTLVDEWGDKFTLDNPFPVQLSDGSVNIGTVSAELEVFMTHKDNDPEPGDVHSSVRIGDGEDEIEVNSDGSINVVVIDSAGSDSLNYEYNEVLAVPSGMETTILTIAVNPDPYKQFVRIMSAGTNVAHISIKVNGNTIAKKYIWHGNFNAEFNLQNLKLETGDILTVTALHNRPNIGDFNATAWYI